MNRENSKTAILTPCNPIPPFLKIAFFFFFITKMAKAQNNFYEPTPRWLSIKTSKILINVKRQVPFIEMWQNVAVIKLKNIYEPFVITRITFDLIISNEHYRYYTPVDLLTRFSHPDGSCSSSLILTVVDLTGFPFFKADGWRTNVFTVFGNKCT